MTDKRSNRRIRAFSYGGGVQSTAALALAAQGEIDFHSFLFCNVGENAENPDTLEYVRTVAMPYAKEHGVELHELRREYRDGRGWTLYDKLLNDKRSLGLPARLEGSGAPGRRSCTVDFKIRVTARWLRLHGAKADNRATIGLGISLDEWHRMRTDSGYDFYGLEYPLVDMRLDRSNCVGIIDRAGLPVPPKSSCWFCPYHTLTAWRDLKRRSPDLFDKAADLESVMSDRGEAMGWGKVFLTDAMIPLKQAVGDGTQLNLFEDGAGCESGYCMV